MPNKIITIVLKDTEIALHRLLNGKLGRSQILMNQNSEVLTPMLQKIFTLIEEKRQKVSLIQVQKGATLSEILLPELKKVASSISMPEISYSDLRMFLPEIFIELGSSLASRGQCWVIILNDFQLMERSDLATFISAVHVANQKNLPILFIGAGSRELTKITGDAKPYSERLFQYRNV